MSLDRVQVIEVDFNNGQKIDLSSHNEKIEHLLELGFDRFKSFEAIIVHSGLLDESIEYLFLSEENQKRVYDQV